MPHDTSRRSSSTTSDQPSFVIWFRLGKPATGPIVSGNPIHYDRRLKPFEYNPDKAGSRRATPR